MTDYFELHELPRQLLVLGDVLDDQTGQLFIEILRLVSGPEPDPVRLSSNYATFFSLLAEEAELYSGELAGNAWQNHVLDRLLDSTGVAARKSRHPGQAGAALREAVNYDLQRLQILCMTGAETLLQAIRQATKDRDLPGWEGFCGLPPARPTSLDRERYELKQAFLACQNWPELFDRLIDYYRKHDDSPFARYLAFRWRREDNNKQRGYFEPVKFVDEQRFENLVGYERERAVVIANTEQFLAGLPANHALLYGARGTGKSSTVKALLPRYGGQGLRLIEVHKSELGDYPLIAEALRDRPEKFILFVDDLSFEAEEFSYKDLKALLEGSLEARPANLLIYATSNRRHLIKEQFSDNARPGDEEVNAWDTVEEKLSLSDRFGLIVTFMAPNQAQYLAIVDGLARQAGIELEPEDLHRRALRWELGHSGRSGRTARQFVDQLAGELRLRQQNG